MPDKTLKQAYEQFQRELRNGKYAKDFQPFFDAVKAADDSMSAMHRRDQYGRIPLLKAEDRDRLLRLHETMGTEAEKLISSKKVPAKYLTSLKKIAALGAANYRHLRAYDPKDLRTLPELLEDVRTRTLDIRFTEQKKNVGSAQNSRQPLSFLDDNGREVAGVFTPKKELNFWKKWDSSFRKAAENMDWEAKDLVNGLMPALDTPHGAEVLGLPKDATRGEKISALYMKVARMTPMETHAGVCKLFADLLSTKERKLEPQDADYLLGNFAKNFEKIIRQDGDVLLNNHFVAGIPDGARIDNRNAAMSAVAELLNVPNLVAKSVPMKVITKDEYGGDIEVEGTFMEAAEGTVMDNLRPEDGQYDKESLADHDGRCMKSIADLQILDFICGNTDRHGTNVAYQFDPKTKKLIGVQGFDNDNAFGTVLPATDRRQQAHFTKPENLLVISKSMYETLKTITPEMLKFSLRGFGLSEAELDAATKRMQIVKERWRRTCNSWRTGRPSWRKGSRRRTRRRCSAATC